MLNVTYYYSECIAFWGWTVCCLFTGGGGVFCGGGLLTHREVFFFYIEIHEKPEFAAGSTSSP